MDISLKNIIMEFLRDAKSRKFLLVVGFLFITVANNTDVCLPALPCFGNFGIQDSQLLIATGMVALFIVIEGIGDIIARSRGTY